MSPLLANRPPTRPPFDHGTLASPYLDFDLHVPDDLSVVPAVVLFGLRLGARMVLSGRLSESTICKARQAGEGLTNRPKVAAAAARFCHVGATFA
jgi:hypothetical protein